MQRAHNNAPVVPQKIFAQPHSSPKAGVTPSLQQEDASAVDSTKKIAKSITTAPEKDQKFGTIQKIEQQQIKTPNDSPPLHKHQQLETGKPQGDISKQDKSETKDKAGFFGFGGARSRSPSPKPAASAVTEKVLGFGTSFFSSASNVISTAVRDEPSTTPPASRKASSVSQSSIISSTPPSSRKGSAVSQALSTTPPTSHKGSSVSQTSTPVTSRKGSDISQDITKDTKKPSIEKEPQPSKTLFEKVKDSAAVDKSPQQLPKTCPLCMTDIKQDVPNYSTCTECKSIVCNLCGFSPMPQETEVSHFC